MDRDMIPDAIEPIRGYRAWRFTLHGSRGSLQPLVGRDDDAWSGASLGWVRATCRIGSVSAGLRAVRDGCICGLAADARLRTRLCPNCGPPHRAPVEGCGCGFYAFKDLDTLVRELSYPAGADIVLGRVDLAGKIIEHEFGYRAEWARIRKLIPIEGTRFRVLMLANALRLPPSGEELSEARLDAQWIERCRQPLARNQQDHQAGPVGRSRHAG
jgi:hypothetical protein